MNILDKLRLCQVKRYPICHTGRDQNVAEHSYNVAVIAMELAKHAGDSFYEAKVAVYALEHDLEEVFTGDIPSSFKRHLRKQCPEVGPLLDGKAAVDAPQDVKAIVKMADYIEAVWFLNEFGGSRLAMTVKEDIAINFAAYLNRTELHPEVKRAAVALWEAVCRQ